MPFADVGPCWRATAASDSPHSLQMQVQVHMASGAIVLDGEAGAHPVLRAGTRGTTTVVRMFPKTMSIATSIAGMGIVTPDGMIVRAGALLPPATSLLREGTAVLCTFQATCDVRWHDQHAPLCAVQI